MSRKPTSSANAHPKEGPKEGPKGVAVKADVPYLQKVHKGGRLTYRRVFPVELQPFICAKAGGSRVHLKVSLGASSITASGAMDRYNAAAALYDRMLLQARKAATRTFDVIDPPTIAYLAELYRHTELARDERHRKSLSPATEPQPFISRDDLEADWKNARTMLAEFDRPGIVGEWGDWAIDYAATQGLTPDPTTEAFGDLCEALAHASGQLWLDLEARIDGKPNEPPPPPRSPHAPSAGRYVTSSPVPILATFERYAAATGMTPGVRDDWRRNVAHLVNFVGHNDAARIATSDLIDWRNALLTQPNSRGKLRDPVTVKGRYVGAAKAMLGWAVSEGLLTTNVAFAVKVTVPKKPQLRSRAFTSAEATAILTASLLPASANMSSGYVLARRWIPWLCAYSGARVNELSQLRGVDVREIDGIWAINITPEAGTVKGKAARLVPLHPDLIDQGFVEAVRPLGDGPLFYDPSRQRVRSDSNRHFKKVGERLGVWVRKEVGVDDPNIMPNHAWRHLFKERAYAAGIQEATADAIQGHSEGTTARSYYNPPLADKAKAIAAMPRFKMPGAVYD